MHIEESDYAEMPSCSILIHPLWGVSYLFGLQSSDAGCCRTVMGKDNMQLLFAGSVFT